MAEILNDEERRDRARDLTGLNGFDLVFVELDEAATPPRALLTAEFLNDVALAGILNAHGDGGVPANQLFAITGGRRRPGGPLPGQVQVTAIAAGPGPAPGLVLTVEPIGDYSTYTLTALSPLFDPIFARIGFKFRPGCFNLNCRPDRTAPDAPDALPRIDYLARDYHSFRHLLIAAMAERVPGWQPTSEADLDQVVIGLLAAAGDELADKQDRVAAEAFFPRARKRLSLARHARLMDYHIHQGNQATTWAAMEVSTDLELPASFACWTGRTLTAASQVFLNDTSAVRRMQPDLNRLELYTWGNLVGALEKGSTAADVTLPGQSMTGAQATDLRDLLRDLQTPLLLEEALNPETGRAAGRDPKQRQLLRLTGAETRHDPVADAWMVRIEWDSADALGTRFCFVARCPGADPEDGVSLFHGNLIQIAHGRPNLTLFTDPARPLDAALAAALSAERTAFTTDYPFGRITEAAYRESRWGRLCPLPEGPLAYRDTPPGGETPPESTLGVSVEGIPDWGEQIDLVQSRADANHFIVETDELGRSTIRFGRAPNGEAPPPGSYVAARYQTGSGPDGNVGAGSISGHDTGAFPQITRLWNPFDVTNGRLPETPEVIRRRAPEAYRARQLRAVTLNDYKRRAEELPFVQRAAAAYGWTGSWRTVRVTLDPRGTTELSAAQRETAARHLDHVRLIGEDIEIRAPDFVPLDIRLVVCAAPRFWPEDLAADLDEAFSEGYTSTGARGFFHPDNWVFGQSLHASQIIARALAVEGVDRVIKVGMRLWDQAGGPSLETLVLEADDLPPPTALRIDVGANQIIRVANDPNALEFGRMTIEVKGGRQ
ncbi:baseplate J/gp47 family protein [Rhodovulum euryhalinum]|uniref:Putative phage baseplate assembly protein n=1 Tax=Rhodovulum euryhalinum TaxID=35805 RepID=A0A4R2KJC4_9RHOB|nr:baseplate J/gp47 family protein [Rhodovulum euryhalinum]TCO70108.1 putative phage baseplate assembly protein [Rhodovulum euryhalinum]